MSDDREKAGNIKPKMFSEDPWMVGFISDCLDIYGCPRNEEDCLTRQEEVWYTYSSMFLMGAIEHMDKETLDEMKLHDTREAAYKYAALYEDLYREPLIMPFMGKDELVSEV